MDLFHSKVFTAYRYTHKKTGQIKACFFNEFYFELFDQFPHATITTVWLYEILYLSVHACKEFLVVFSSPHALQQFIHRFFGVHIA